MDPLIGKSFGPYKVIAKIGEGGMATVYKGLQESLNRFVAIKVLRGDLARNPEFVARFRREALAVARLSHPNLLHVYDAGTAHGVYYIIIDFVPGGSLQDLLVKGHLEPERAVSIVAQVADALDCAHKQGIIHRDVKPNNILMTPEGRPLLADFGIAKAVYESTHLTHTGTSIGTPAYMAPEQAEGKPSDARTDIYALGIVLYETLTGRVPFRGETPMATLYSHLHTPPPPIRQLNPNVPVWLEEIVDKALAKPPEARYQTAAQFSAALRPPKTPEAVAAPARPGRKTPTPLPQPSPAALAERRAPKARRSGLLAVLILSIVILVALLAVGSYVLMGGGSRGAATAPPEQTQAEYVTVVVTAEVVTVVVTSAPLTLRGTEEPSVAADAVPKPAARATPDLRQAALGWTGLQP